MFESKNYQNTHTHPHRPTILMPRSEVRDEMNVLQLAAVRNSFEHFVRRSRLPVFVRSTAPTSSNIDQASDRRSHNA